MTPRKSQSPRRVTGAVHQAAANRVDRAIDDPVGEEDERGGEEPGRYHVAAPTAGHLLGWAREGGRARRNPRARLEVEDPRRLLDALSISAFDSFSTLSPNAMLSSTETWLTTWSPTVSAPAEMS